MLIIFFLPLWLNFAGLSGLANFYASAAEEFNENRRKTFLVLLVTANVIFLTLNVAISISLASDSASVDHSTTVVSVLYNSYATSIDLTLASTLAYLGMKSHRSFFIHDFIDK